MVSPLLLLFAAAPAVGAALTRRVGTGPILVSGTRLAIDLRDGHHIPNAIQLWDHTWFNGNQFWGQSDEGDQFYISRINTGWCLAVDWDSRIFISGCGEDSYASNTFAVEQNQYLCTAPGNSSGTYIGGCISANTTLGNGTPLHLGNNTEEWVSFSYARDVIWGATRNESVPNIVPDWEDPATYRVQIFGPDVE